MKNDSFPNIIILTDDCISRAHGTGARLLQHFSDYPGENLLNIFWYSSDKPSLPNFLEIPQPSFNWGQRFLRKSYRTVTGLSWQEQDNRSFARQLNGGLGRILGDSNFTPKVIYSNCCCSQGLVLLHKIAEHYKGKIKILQHFHDIVGCGDTKGYEKVLQGVAPIMTEIWALNSNISKRISTITNRDVKTVNFFCDKLPNQYKRNHRDLTKDFIAVLLGNIWIPDLIQDIKSSWNWIRSKVPGIGPIQWFCHPNTIETLKKHGFDLGDDIVHGGFYVGDELYRRLQSADLAIVPFNRGKKPESDYARYSLPSRITEISCAGLPTFFEAGPKTATFNYACEYGIGICEIPQTMDQFRNRLFEFMKDKSLRERCGKKARNLAENNFDIDHYRTFLFDKLTSLSAGSK